MSLKGAATAESTISLTPDQLAFVREKSKAGHAAYLALLWALRHPEASLKEACRRHDLAENAITALLARLPRMAAVATLRSAVKAEQKKRREGRRALAAEKSASNPGAPVVRVAFGPHVVREYRGKVRKVGW